jgi:hypothetical protein
MDVGKKLCYALLIYCDIDVVKSLNDMTNNNHGKASQGKKGSKKAKQGTD